MKILNNAILIQQLPIAGTNRSLHIIVNEDGTGKYSLNNGATWLNINVKSMKKLMANWDYYMDPKEQEVICELPLKKVA